MVVLACVCGVVLCVGVVSCVCVGVLVWCLVCVGVCGVCGVYVVVYVVVCVVWHAENLRV